MITINYTLPIYIRPKILSGECYIINSHDDHNYVFYQNDKTMFDIADFVTLYEAIEYCVLKINSGLMLI